MTINRREFLGGLLGLAAAGAVIGTGLMSNRKPDAKAEGNRPVPFQRRVVAYHGLQPQSPTYPYPTQVSYHDTITSAISSLPVNGGRVVVYEGTYQDEKFKLPANVRLHLLDNVVIYGARISIASPIILDGNNIRLDGCRMIGEGDTFPTAIWFTDTHVA